MQPIAPSHMQRFRREWWWLGLGALLVGALLAYLLGVLALRMPRRPGTIGS